MFSESFDRKWLLTYNISKNDTYSYLIENDVQNYLGLYTIWKKVKLQFNYVYTDGNTIFKENEFGEIGRLVLLSSTAYRQKFWK